MRLLDEDFALHCGEVELRDEDYFGSTVLLIDSETVGRLWRVRYCVVFMGGSSSSRRLSASHRS